MKSDLFKEDESLSLSSLFEIDFSSILSNEFLLLFLINSSEWGKVDKIKLKDFVLSLLKSLVNLFFK